jgi:hypothetical protein
VTDGERSGGSVGPFAAVAFSTIGFVALLIAGLGLTSLFTQSDVIETPGLGQAPGVAAALCATAVFAGSVALTVRTRGAQHPSFANTAWIAAATFVAYLAGMWWGAVLTGADLAAAAAIAGRVATTWFAVVVLGAAAVSAWGAIALVRTRTERPRWPWEDDADE